MATRIIVLGCYRSGSSAVASILHHLGVDMGMPFHKEHFECDEVAEKLRAWWNEPVLEETTNKEERVDWLRQWIEQRERSGSTHVGIKHPLAACRPEDFSEAWGDAIKVIWSTRSLSESIASLQRTQWMAGFDEERIQRILHARISEFVSVKEHLIIDNSELRIQPLREVGKLVDYLDLKPDSKVLGAAFNSLCCSF